MRSAAALRCVIGVVLALLFLLTAALKLTSPVTPDPHAAHHHAASSPRDLVEWLGQPWVQSTLIVVELCLAAALLVPSSRRGAFRAASVFFVAGLLITGLLVRAGEPTSSCGCFGSHSVDGVTHVLLLTGALVLSLTGIHLERTTR